MNRQLALTTQQIKLGVMVQHEQGYSFYPAWLAALYVLTFTAGIVGRLAVDTAAAVGYLAACTAAAVGHHTMIFTLGLQVIVRQVDYAIRG